MTFEVATVPVRAGHWRVAIAAVLVLAVGLIGIAAINRPVVALAQRATTLNGDALAALRLPDTLDCHDLARRTCELATHAALGLFAPSDGRVTGAAAWKSLLCGTAIDCPPSRLTADATPLGSVIVTFASGPAAWVNVLERASSEPSVQAASAEAWVIRWQ